MIDSISTQQPGLHLMAKPIGPHCNLNCEYCFYIEKRALFPKGKNYRMPKEVLQAYISKYISSQPAPVVEFVWQGGEPTLLGIGFFRSVIEFQKPFASQKQIKNSLQTNGTLLTDKWCDFLKKHNFLVGLSIDGPRDIHDRYRLDRKGKPTFDKAMRGLELLQKHGIEYNIMACVARETAKKPLDVYHFFKEHGMEFIQFTPIVERVAAASEKHLGFNLARPALLDTEEPNIHVTNWSVEPEEYGNFLITVYDEWVRNDVGKIFVMNFEWALNAWIGNPSPICIFAEQCGRSIVLEHNGDMFACDHSVYPEYKLGNILKDSPHVAVEKSLQIGFGSCKATSLTRWCHECDVLTACYGGCPKHRFAKTYYGEPGLHYLCPSYKKFFAHIRKYLKVMAQLLEHGLPVSYVMEALKGPLVIKTDKLGKKGWEK